MTVEIHGKNLKGETIRFEATATPEQQEAIRRTLLLLNQGEQIAKVLGSDASSEASRIRFAFETADVSFSSGPVQPRKETKEITGEHVSVENDGMHVHVIDEVPTDQPQQILKA